MPHRRRWRLGAFQVLRGDGQRVRVFGWTRGGLAVFDCTTEHEGATRDISYIVETASGIMLAAFETRREAQMAASILDDHGGYGVADDERVFDAWRRAGFAYAEWTDAVGNEIWRRPVFIAGGVH